MTSFLSALDNFEPFLFKKRETKESCEMMTRFEELAEKDVAYVSGGSRACCSITITVGGDIQSDRC